MFKNLSKPCLLNKPIDWRSKGEVAREGERGEEKREKRRGGERKKGRGESIPV